MLSELYSPSRGCWRRDWRAWCCWPSSSVWRPTRGSTLLPKFPSVLKYFPHEVLLLRPLHGDGLLLLLDWPREVGAGLSSRQILHEDHRLRAGQCLRLRQGSLNKVRREVRKSAGSMLTLQRMSLDLPADPPGGGMCPTQPRHSGARQGRRRGQK